MNHLRRRSFGQAQFGWTHHRRPKCNWPFQPVLAHGKCQLYPKMRKVTLGTDTDSKQLRSHSEHAQLELWTKPGQPPKEEELSISWILWQGTFHSIITFIKTTLSTAPRGDVFSSIKFAVQQWYFYTARGENTFLGSIFLFIYIGIWE